MPRTNIALSLTRQRHLVGGLPRLSPRVGSAVVFWCTRPACFGDVWPRPYHFQFASKANYKWRPHVVLCCQCERGNNLACCVEVCAHERGIAETLLHRLPRFAALQKCCQVSFAVCPHSGRRHKEFGTVACRVTHKSSARARARALHTSILKSGRGRHHRVSVCSSCSC